MRGYRCGRRGGSEQDERPICIVRVSPHSAAYGVAVSAGQRGSLDHNKAIDPSVADTSDDQTQNKRSVLTGLKVIVFL